MLLDLYRSRNPISPRTPRPARNRPLAVESLEGRMLLTAGALVLTPVELIGPVPAEAAAPALIGPQIAPAPASASPFEPSSDPAFAEGEGESAAPVITSLYAVEMYGLKWLEGSAWDDLPSQGVPGEGVTIYFYGVCGESSSMLQEDYSFWSAPFPADTYGDVYAYAIDADGNRSETITIMV